MSVVDPIRVPEEDQTAISELDAFYRRSDSWEIRFVGPDREESVELPESVATALREVIEYMSRGAAVSIVPVHKELTTQEAADILNVSRQYLVRLLDNGEIPHHKVNRHRRIRFGDLMDYKERRDATRREGLDKLTRMSEEMGQYD